MKTTGTNDIRKLRGPQLGNRVSRVLVGIFYRKDDHSMLLGKLGELIKQQPEKVLPPHLPDIADDNVRAKRTTLKYFLHTYSSEFALRRTFYVCLGHVAVRIWWIGGLV